MGYQEKLSELDLVTDTEFARASGMSIHVVRSWVVKAGVAHFTLDGSRTLMLSGAHAVEALEARKAEMVANPSRPRVSARAKDEIAALVNRFLDEWTTPSNRRTPVYEIYAAYIQWCGIQGVAPASKQKLGREMTARGYGAEFDGTIYYRNGMHIPTRERIAEMVLEGRKTADDRAIAG